MKKLACLLSVVPLMLALQVTRVYCLSGKTNAKLSFLPTSLSIQQASQAYPQSLWRTLFSSVPKREFAVKNITFEAQSEMILLLGASSSGKSTILRLVSRLESPVSGDLVCDPPKVKPVYLDRKPPFDDTNTIHTILRQQSRKEQRAVDSDFLDIVIYEVCNIIGFSTDDLNKKPSQLTPSETYRFGLACATLESILPTLQDKEYHAMLQVEVQSPILLLDEWMDFEPSDIVHRVEESLLRLTRQGAVVLCVTHKPQHFARKHRSITMCGGQILFHDTTSKTL